MKLFYAYMLECCNGAYYVGHTDDLELRFAQHQDGTFRGYTSVRRPVRLVWVSDAQSRDDAFSMEMRVKRWGRAKKEALIREDWGALKRLARGANRGAGAKHEPRVARRQRV